MKKSIIFFSILMISISGGFVSCKKEKSDLNHKKLDAFLDSKVYKNFSTQFPGRLSGIDLSSVKFNSVDEALSTIHIPIKKNGDIWAVIIGIPVDRKGNFELLYQDNSSALTGTGVINQYTSTNSLFGNMHLENGKLKDVVLYGKPEIRSATINEGSGVIVSGFWQDLNTCYNQTKANFPGDAACSLLDIFWGVCSAATVTTCLIKLAAQ